VIQRLVGKESQYLRDQAVILVHKYFAAKVPDYKEVARIPGVGTTIDYVCGISFIPKFEEFLFT
jgi:hypothetical protein